MSSRRRGRSARIRANSLTRSDDPNSEFEHIYVKKEKRQHRRTGSDPFEVSDRKQRRLHQLSNVTVARYAQHYEDHGALLKTEPPADTYKMSLRYSREAHKQVCHWKPKSNSKSVPDLYEVGVQAALKGPSESRLAVNQNLTKEMTVQTRPAPEIVPVRDVDYEPLLVEILKRVKGIHLDPCPGAHVPEDAVPHIISGIESLSATIKLLSQAATVIEGKEDDIFKAIRQVKPLPCGGPHVSEQLLQSINRLMVDLEAYIRSAKDDSRIVDFLNKKMNQMNEMVQELRQEHGQILMAVGNIQIPAPQIIKESDPAPQPIIQRIETKGDGVPKVWLEDVHSILLEIVGMLRKTPKEEKKAHIVISRESTPCTCSEITKIVTSESRFYERKFLPSICQRCTNDHRGREFIRNLQLPLSMDTDLVNRVGRIVQAIMDDDENRLKQLMPYFEEDTPNWHPEERQKCNEAFLHFALIWDRQICAQFLSEICDSGAMVSKIRENKRIFNLSDFVKSAAEAQNPEVLVDLLTGLSDHDKQVVINSPAIYRDKKELSLFEAARRGDVNCFKVLLENGAQLDLLENGQSILHCMALLSRKKRKLPAAEEWKKAISRMLDMYYDHAPVWWTQVQGIDKFGNASASSVKNALRYLLKYVKNSDGLDALEYAVTKAQPYVIEKIVSNPPYFFLPQPFSDGYHTGEVGYVVEGLDSSSKMKGDAVLDRLVRRPPEEAGPILKLQPFKAIIRDKWKRYSPFLGLGGLCYLAYMCIFTAVVFVRPPLSQRTFDEMYNESEDWARFIGEVIVLICLPFFIYGEICLLIQKIWTLWNPMHWFDIFRLLNILFFILVIVAFILRCLRHEDEDIVLALCLICGWFNAIQFLAAWKRTGMFPVILHWAFREDFVQRFIPAYCLAFLACSTATYVVYQGADPVVPPYTNETFFWTPFSMFKMSFALLNADHVDNARSEPMGVILFFTFVLVCILIFLYLLLAMFADKYGYMRNILDENWIWVRAAFCLYLETRLPSSFWISYDPEESKKYRSLFGETNCKYVVRVDRRRKKDGGIVEEEERAILIPRQDPPIPDFPPIPYSHTCALLEVTDVRSPRRHLPNDDSLKNGYSYHDLEDDKKKRIGKYQKSTNSYVIDLNDVSRSDSPVAMEALPESLPPAQTSTSRTILSGKINKVDASRRPTTEL